MRTEAPAPWRRRLRGAAVALGRVTLFGLVLAGVGGAFGWQWFKTEILATLPTSLGPATEFRVPCSVQVFDTAGERVDQFYLERRVWVPRDELPDYVWQSFIASEDRRFFEHEGVDPQGIARALIVNLTGGGTSQGGSTITQQLVKNLLVGKERSYRRKLREAVLAYRLEGELSKLQLIEMYVNYIALGNGNYGVEAAAQDYFGVSARELDPGQAALLAGLVPAPSRYSPRHSPELAASRREIVLKLMVSQGYLTAAEASRHLADPVMVPRATGAPQTGAAYLTEVRREVRRLFGNDMPFVEGMQVYTPYEPNVQSVAEEAAGESLRALEARQGARGPTRNIADPERDAWLARGDRLRIDVDTRSFRPPEPGECFAALADDAEGHLSAGPFRLQLAATDLDTKVRRARKGQADKSAPAADRPRPLREVLQRGDVLEVCLADDGTVHRKERPWAEIAVVVIENATGNVIALTGGYDVGLEGFIRATQARRQPGSSFKPIVYASAVIAGRRQTDLVFDAPFSVIGTNGRPWSPKNYDGKYHGNIPLRTAMALSLNTVAVRLAADVGVEKLVSLARGLGVQSPLRSDLTVALGSSEITPMDAAMVYSSLARGGVRVGPVLVTRVLDRKGEQLAAAGQRVQLGGEERSLPGGPGERVMRAEDAYVTVDMMRNVFTNGTAKKGRRPGMDFAGKTGTTSNFVDAWFVGYSPRYTVAVWVGTDGQSSIGDKETGGKAALPTWSRVMEALPNVEGERFPVPEGAVLLPGEAGWLGYTRDNPPPDVLAVPELTEDSLPPFGFSYPAARAQTAAPPAGTTAPRVPLAAEAPATGAEEEGAGDPTTQPPVEEIEVPGAPVPEGTDRGPAD
jgi:penicillin-binding protein 1A